MLIECWLRCFAWWRYLFQCLFCHDTFSTKELFTYNRENFKFDQDQRIEREAWPFSTWCFFNFVICGHVAYPAKFRCFDILFTLKNWPCFCEALRLEMQVKRFELFREAIACGHNAVSLFHFCRVCEGGQCWMLHCQDVRDLVELTVDRMDVYHLVPLCMCFFFGAQSPSIPSRHLHPAHKFIILRCYLHPLIFLFFWDVLIAIVLLHSWLLTSTLSGGSAFLGILHCALLWRPSAGWDTCTHTNVFLVKLASEMNLF